MNWLERGDVTFRGGRSLAFAVIGVLGLASALAQAFAGFLLWLDTGVWNFATFGDQLGVHEPVAPLVGKILSVPAFPIFALIGVLLLRSSILLGMEILHGNEGSNEKKGRSD